VAAVKAPRWLTQSFARGIDERQPKRPPKPAYPGANGYCWLTCHDDRRRPCSGRLERFHFIPRQRVENALRALLPGWGLERVHYAPHVDSGDFKAWRDDLILLAAWDSRNGGLGCEGHHRRLDSHLTPPLWVRYENLPDRVVHFAFDWGIEGQLDRFPSEI
jgi:hypothetical protein